MSTRTLPSHPNLAQLKLQATELRRLHRSGDRAAAARIVAHHPRMKGLTLEQVLEKPLTLADAQTVLAREYGYPNWAELKHFVELQSKLARFKPHPRFDEALAAMDYGDLEALRKILKANPELVHARTNLEPPYGYFTGAMLLHHIAGNPDRGRFSGKLPPLPKNSAEIARLLLDFGADVNARTIGTRKNGASTMGLIITSKLATDGGIAGAMMDVLLERGAELDLKSPGVLDSPLANYGYQAAEKMIELGAKPDVCAAAALGRMELLRDCFDDEGRLKFRPRRHGKQLSERDAIGLALLFAYVSKRSEAVDFLLEKDGNWNMIGVNNGTALHRAACGDLPMVQRLVAKGADISDRNNPYNATPLSWADHEKFPEVKAWLRANCPIDIHDAVCFHFPEHVASRIKENPQCVNQRIDQWRFPQSTPLHHAARMSHVKFVKLLLEHGADPSILAGDGRTALQMAEESGAAEAIRLLKKK